MLQPSIDIAQRLREVLLNGKWIANTNFKEQLESTTWLEATHQVAGLNSIAQLSFHINYYIKGLLKVLQSGPLDIKDKYSFDMPALQSEGEWQALVADFVANATLFAEMVEALPAVKLEGPFIEAQYGTYARNIEAIIEHSYYHLGQISLLKKLIS